MTSDQDPNGCPQPPIIAPTLSDEDLKRIMNAPLKPPQHRQFVVEPLKKPHGKFVVKPSAVKVTKSE